MLLKRNYSPDHLKEVAALYPNLGAGQLVTTVFAFGLLQALSDSGLPFHFKGGTSLLLLLKSPRRLSTDIDIVVPKKTDFDRYFAFVKDRFPFYSGEERGKTENRYFRHFYFYPKAEGLSEEISINLDVAFEDHPFIETTEREIALPFLLSDGVVSQVKLPSVSALLGDKLTAFAPHTIGVNPHFTSLGKRIDNRLQVMKQMYDIACLFDERPNFSVVKESFLRSVGFENQFRGSSFRFHEVLQDAFEAALCIASSGQFDPKGEFKTVFKPGIQGLSSCVFSGRYTQQEAANDATKVALVCAGLIKDFDIFSRNDFPIRQNKDLRLFKRILDPEAFERIRAALCLWSDQGPI